MNKKIFVMLALVLSLVLVAVTSVSHAHSVMGILGPYMLYSLPVGANALSIAVIAVLVVISGTAIVYMLAKVTHSQGARAWAMSQIYEALLSLVMLLIFFSFVSVLFINPQTAYGSLGLVPSGCTSSSNVFELAVCDMTTFNNNALFLTNVAFVTEYILGLSPGASITFFKAPLVDLASPVTVSLKVSEFMPSIVPLVSYASSTIDLKVLLLAITVSDVQSILLGGSILFLSFFITIGLVSRIFGFSRSFGGLMVAFGLGLGIVYPLLVTITYGFITTNMLSSSNILSLLPNIGKALVGAVVGSLSVSPLSATSFFSLVGAPVVDEIVLIFKDIGYTVVGLSLIPFMNFMLLETFITDFSSAIGERMSFMVLLGGFI